MSNIADKEEPPTTPLTFTENVRAIAADGRLAWLIFAFVIMLGVCMRIFGLGHRSLWVDEAWVANLVESENYLSVILYDKEIHWSPLPLLFAMSAKLAISLFGRGEAAFRLFPLLFGVGSLAALSLVGRQLFAKSKLWMVPACLLALQPMAIYYSKELKQYSGEIFFSALMLYLFMRVLEKKTAGSVTLLFLSGLFAIGFGLPVIFLACGVSLVLSARLYQQDEKRLAFGVLSAMFALGIAQIALYAFWIAPQARITFSAWWSESFSPDSLIAFPRWLVNRGFSQFNYDFGYATPLMGATMASFALRFAFLVGMIAMFFKKKRDLIYIYAIVMSFLLALAIMHKWPFGGSRVNLFLLPFHLIFVASGIGVMASALAAVTRKASVHWAAGSLCVIALLPMQSFEDNIFDLREREEMRPLMEYVKDNFDPATQRIYVYSRGREAFLHYWSLDTRFQDPALYHLGPLAWEDNVVCLEDMMGYLASQPPTVESVYLVFSHVREKEKRISVDFIRANIGDEIDAREVTGAAAYLFSAKNDTGRTPVEARRFLDSLSSEEKSAAGNTD